MSVDRIHIEKYIEEVDRSNDLDGFKKTVGRFIDSMTKQFNSFEEEFATQDQLTESAGSPDLTLLTARIVLLEGSMSSIQSAISDLETEIGNLANQKVVTQTISAMGTVTINFASIGTATYDIIAPLIMNETDDAVQTPIIIASSKTATSFQIKALTTGEFSCVIHY